jgi:uncharacterized protein YegP (UPF0339 family)
MAKFEIFRDVRGEYRWRLRSADGQVFALGGEGFRTKASAQSAISAVKHEAPTASVVDTTESPVTHGVLTSRMEPGLAKKKLPPPL